MPPVFVPPQVSFMVSRGDTTITVFEHKPGPKTILFAGQAYTISLPHIHFVFVQRAHKKRMLKYVFAGYDRIQSLNQNLYSAPLPNVFDDGSVCMSSASDPEKYISKFWKSAFSKDVTINLQGIFSGYLSSHTIMIKWEEKTRNDPNFWRKIDLHPKMTLGEFVEEYLPKSRPTPESNEPDEQVLSLIITAINRCFR